jgi:SagB-type dehydrogenase family enzyme
MINGDSRIARRFHDQTAHSYASVRSSGHTLDWDVKPLPFKIYPDLPEVALPAAMDPPASDALTAIAGPWRAAASLTLDALASVLFFSAGLTRTRRPPEGAEIHFRAAPSTGALYQTEVYLVAGPIEGLGAGVYHFSPADFRLRRLREGDYREVIAAAAAEPELARRPLTLVLSAIYWRNTWKYQARAYRHLFWDSGTILANILAVAGSLGLAPRVLLGFVDADVNRLLGLDPAREAALELVGIGPGGPGRAAGDPPPPEVAPISPRVLPLSADEVDYPALREVHAASMLDSPEVVRAWRGSGPLPARTRRGPAVALPPPRPAAGRDLGETIRRRGSTRRFSREPLTAVDLSTALSAATAPTPTDVSDAVVSVYLIISAVDGIEPGSYCYWPGDSCLEPLRAGDHRAQSAYLCLEQPLGGEAAAVLYYLAPLAPVLAAWGNRGYRLAHLAAGISGGRAYLAAYAQGFGASGLTFYDRDVAAFFLPHAAGSEAIFVTALGRSVRMAPGAAVGLRVG